MWPMIAMAAASALSSANQQGAQRDVLARESIAQNEAIIKANVANTIRVGYSAGILNLRRGLQKKQALQQGFGITAAGQDALAHANANQAATGSVGASADAVVNDIQMKIGEAQAQASDTAELDAINFNIQLGELIQQGKSALQSAVKVDLASTEKIMGNALFAGAASFGSNYMLSQMRLGLGTPTSPVTSSSPQIPSGFDKGVL